MNRHKTILIIGNDEDRQHYVHLLKQSSEQYVVLEAKDGRSGIELYRSQPIDCVILGYDLPDVSSLRVLIQLVPRPRHPKTAVILLSNNPIPGMAVIARNNGAQAYLVKTDVTGDELEAVIRKAIAAVSPTRKPHGLPPRGG
ncbi:MAG TPA: response regulator [Nitrospira sp.]|nr:response regulator [Nitrospira sp.]